MPVGRPRGRQALRQLLIRGRPIRRGSSTSSELCQAGRRYSFMPRLRLIKMESRIFWIRKVARGRHPNLVALVASLAPRGKPIFLGGVFTGKVGLRGRLNERRPVVRGIDSAASCGVFRSVARPEGLIPAGRGRPTRARNPSVRSRAPTFHKRHRVNREPGNVLDRR